MRIKTRLIDTTKPFGALQIPQSIKIMLAVVFSLHVRKISIDAVLLHRLNKRFGSVLLCFACFSSCQLNYSLHRKTHELRSNTHMQCPIAVVDGHWASVRGSGFCGERKMKRNRREMRERENKNRNRNKNHWLRLKSRLYFNIIIVKRKRNFARFVYCLWVLCNALLISLAINK